MTSRLMAPPSPSAEPAVELGGILEHYDTPVAIPRRHASPFVEESPGDARRLKRLSLIEAHHAELVRGPVVDTSGKVELPKRVSAEEGVAGFGVLDGPRVRARV